MRLMVGRAHFGVGQKPHFLRHGDYGLSHQRRAYRGCAAHGIHPEEAVAAYALTYRFSKNKDTTRRYLETQTTNAYDPLVMQAAKSALALSLLK